MNNKYKIMPYLEVNPNGRLISIKMISVKNPTLISKVQSVIKRLWGMI